MDDARRGEDLAIYEDFDNRYLRQDRRLGIERDTLAALPLVDVSSFARANDEAGRAGAARELRKACIDIGFCYLKGHGIASADVDALLGWGRRFLGHRPWSDRTL